MMSFEYKSVTNPCIRLIEWYTTEEILSRILWISSMTFYRLDSSNMCRDSYHLHCSVNGKNLYILELSNR
jgi:hypothetical protein